MVTINKLLYAPYNHGADPPAGVRTMPYGGLYFFEGYFSLFTFILKREKGLIHTIIIIIILYNIPYNHGISSKPEIGKQTAFESQLFT